MDRDELRVLQAPLKDRYAEEPAAAVITLHAEGSLGEGISGKVATGHAIAEAGLHPATGGDGSLLCSGDLDFRGTLAVDREAPVGFTDIRLAFELDADATEEQLDTLLKLAERYCVVLQTLAKSPALSVSRSRV